MVEQLPEQVELLRCELDLLLADARLAAARVDREVAVHEDGALALRALGRGAAQDRAHARDELARVERLRHVVVGADLEPDDLVDVLVARRQHQHRQVARLRGSACRPRRRRCRAASGRARRARASRTGRASALPCRSQSCARCSRRSSDTRRRTTRSTPRPRRPELSAACRPCRSPSRSSRSALVGLDARQRDEVVAVQRVPTVAVRRVGEACEPNRAGPDRDEVDTGAVDEDGVLPADGAELEAGALPDLCGVAPLRVERAARRRSPAARPSRRVRARVDDDLAVAGDLPDHRAGDRELHDGNVASRDVRRLPFFTTSEPSPGRRCRRAQQQARREPRQAEDEGEPPHLLAKYRPASLPAIQRSVKVLLRGTHSGRSAADAPGRPARARPRAVALRGAGRTPARRSSSGSASRTARRRFSATAAC